MNWTIEMIEKARKIYQARHGGDYFENGEIIKRVVSALQEAAEQSVQADGAWVCDRCGHNATSQYCSNCNLPFPPRR